MGPYSPFFGYNEYRAAVYRDWHPKFLHESRGCIYWWSTRSDECHRNNMDHESCKAGPVKNDENPDMVNRVYYPCGLGARAWTSSGGQDKVAIVDKTTGTQTVLKTTPEDISVDTDYKKNYRNLDPDAVFDKQWIEQEVNGEGKELHGYKFKHILQMHLLDDHPPVVCSDDPLELVKPEIDPSLENV